jgi:hypothetical protein
MDDHSLIMRMHVALHIKRKIAIHTIKVEIQRTFCIVVFHLVVTIMYTLQIIIHISR